MEHLKSKRMAVHASLVRGLSFLLVLSVLQRLIGFERSVYFCRVLDASSYGLWELSYGFLVVVSPLVVFSLPGVLGRYATRFEQLGVLRRFISKLGLICMSCTCCVSVTLLLFPAWWCRWLYHSQNASLFPLLMWTAIALVVTNGMNFFWETFTALKDLRSTAWLQFGNSLLFAGLSKIYLRESPTAVAAMTAYSMACGVTLLWSVWRARYRWRQLPVNREFLSTTTMLRQVGPTALWLWSGVVLILSFDYFDRLLPVHLVGAEVAIRWVGTYGCARVVPQLLVSVTTMFVAVLMPHFATDWERGQKRRLSARWNFFWKFQTLLLVSVALAILWAVPLVLRPLFLERYPGAESILPWVTVGAILPAMIVIVQTYLTCAERLGRAVLILAMGLCLKVGFATLLIPRYGLSGMVFASVLSSGSTLILLLYAAYRSGLRVRAASLGWVGVAILPGLGALWGTLGWCVVMASAYWWIHRSEWRRIRRVMRHFRPYHTSSNDRVERGCDDKDKIGRL